MKRIIVFKTKVLISCLLFLSIICYAQDSTAYPIDKNRGKALFYISTVMLAASYAVTVGTDLALDGQIVFGEIVVPVAGPIIALCRYNSVISPSYSGRTTDRSLLALSAAAQTLSLVGLVSGLSMMRKTRKQLYSNTASWSVGVNGMGGIRVVYTF